MTIDSERLKTDAAYWDEVAPEGATHYVDGVFTKWVHGVEFDYNEDTKEWVKSWLSYPLERYLDQPDRWDITPRPAKPAESEPMSDDCLAAKIGEIGNQIHNLGCDNQNNEELSDRLGELAIALWDIAKQVPTGSPTSEWCGEGLPPVGCECEYVIGMDRYPVRVVGFCNDEVVIFQHNGASDYVGCQPGYLQPIRTKEQRQRDALVDLCIKSIHQHDSAHAAHIADAILSRYNLEPKK